MQSYDFPGQYMNREILLSTTKCQSNYCRNMHQKIYQAEICMINLVLYLILENQTGNQ